MESVDHKARFKVNNPELIQLYSAATPNGIKVACMLEELTELRAHKEEFTYEAHSVNLREAETRQGGYTKLAPHGKIPCIVDPHGPST